MSDYIKMNRRDWLKRAFSKTKEVSLKATSNALGNFVGVSDTLKEYRWENILPFQELGSSPKQLMYKGRSVFVIRHQGTVSVYQGICPVDNKLVNWQNHTQQFYCPHCETRYKTSGKALHDETISLYKYPIRIKEGKIQVRTE